MPAKTFEAIAQMKDADAMESLLHLRSHGYSVLTLQQTTGLSQADIERLLALGIVRLVKMGWSQERIAFKYGFSSLVVDTVLRAAAKNVPK